jgi:hypothetical protein
VVPAGIQGPRPASNFRCGYDGLDGLVGIRVGLAAAWRRCTPVAWLRLLLISSINLLVLLLRRVTPVDLRLLLLMRLELLRLLLLCLLLLRVPRVVMGHLVAHGRGLGRTTVANPAHIMAAAVHLDVHLTHRARAAAARREALLHAAFLDTVPLCDELPQVDNHEAPCDTPGEEEVDTQRTAAGEGIHVLSPFLQELVHKTKVAVGAPTLFAAHGHVVGAATESLHPLRRPVRIGHDRALHCVAGLRSAVLRLSVLWLSVLWLSVLLVLLTILVSVAWLLVALRVWITVAGLLLAVLVGLRRRIVVSRARHYVYVPKLKVPRVRPTPFVTASCGPEID